MFASTTARRLPHSPAERVTSAFAGDRPRTLGNLVGFRRRGRRRRRGGNSVPPGIRRGQCPAESFMTEENVSLTPSRKSLFCRKPRTGRCCCRSSGPDCPAARRRDVGGGRDHVRGFDVAHEFAGQDLDGARGRSFERHVRARATSSRRSSLAYQPVLLFVSATLKRTRAGESAWTVSAGGRGGAREPAQRRSPEFARRRRRSAAAQRRMPPGGREKRTRGIFIFRGGVGC